MAVKTILSYFNKEDREMLQSKSEPITDILSEETQQIIQDLKDTLLDANSKGQRLVGLSAVQIGVLKQICIIKYDIYFLTIINPIITQTRGEKVFYEGCASVPGVQIPITRFQKVWADYYDENGVLKHADQGGLFSDILQHEMDHFNGEDKVASVISFDEKEEIATEEEEKENSGE